MDYENESVRDGTYSFSVENNTLTLNDGAENDLLYRDIDIKPNDHSAEIGFEYPTDVQTATYSDKEWEDKTFEALDPTANMSPDDKAGYVCMQQSKRTPKVRKTTFGVYFSSITRTIAIFLLEPAKNHANIACIDCSKERDANTYRGSSNLTSSVLVKLWSKFSAK